MFWSGVAPSFRFYAQSNGRSLAGGWSQAFKLPMIATAILVFITWLSLLDTHIVPYKVAERTYPRLCPSLTILIIAYLASYAYTILNLNIPFPHSTSGSNLNPVDEAGIADMWSTD